MDTKRVVFFTLISTVAYVLMSASISPRVPSETALWHIKAIHPDGKFLDVKAFDPDGNAFDVKALELNDNRHVMDIKALVGVHKDIMLPVKVLYSNEALAPVKAIGEDGTIYDIKAITRDNYKLDVKGVGHSGNIIHIKAISQYGMLFGVKAIAPSGRLHDVKGIKMIDFPVEGVVNGVEIHAHVKALPPAIHMEGEPIWNVHAIHQSGVSFPIKAFDDAGNMCDVKAYYENGNAHMLDIRALINGKKLPVAILAEADDFASVKAIGEDGSVYDIKALTPDNQLMDILGASLAGNIIHVKASDSEGVFHGVKAISPSGQLYDIKGIKMSKEVVEGKISGVRVRAYVKALPQVY